MQKYAVGPGLEPAYLILAHKCKKPWAEAMNGQAKEA
jgi:hypothetical protein